ncbi:Serine protease inhibitor A3L [Sarcoptes scabiei]|uniref:Serine protease inhibitor A3L n=1 Tax=Sarcoptes scabiei TaxID=52283 RepID=A0A834RI94_SARSC|nr:Serine protease inhibitor A3L [Sarcoptes scabiei]
MDSESAKNSDYKIRFSLDLMKNLYQRDKNLVFSSFSLTSALLMLLIGSKNKTRKNIFKFIFGSENELLLASSMNEIDKFILENKNLITSFNMIYTDKRLPINSYYIDKLNEIHHGSVQSLDFTQIDATRKLINNEIREATNGRISEMIESLRSDIIMILINAISFKGIWKYKFNKEQSFQGEFVNSTGKHIPTTMMRIEAHLQYCEFRESKLSFVKIPYASGTMSMLIAKSHHCDSKIDLIMPKFTIQSNHDLAPIIKRMGLIDIFDARANFSNISNENLFVSDILQKAIIEVTEDGTEAAAATAIMMARCVSQTIAFKIDRTFIFFLISEIDNQILFAGIVEDPNN